MWRAQPAASTGPRNDLIQFQQTNNIAQKEPNNERIGEMRNTKQFNYFMSQQTNIGQHESSIDQHGHLGRSIQALLSLCNYTQFRL